MFFSLGKQIVYMSIIGISPLIWFRANEGDRIVELMKQKNYADILAWFRNNENLFRLLLTSGITAIASGIAYLQLPLKLFIGWLPFVGRVDTFFAKIFVLAGFASLSGALLLEGSIIQKK